jgi:hypothetical protein
MAPTGVRMSRKTLRPPFWSYIQNTKSTTVGNPLGLCLDGDDGEEGASQALLQGLCPPNYVQLVEASEHFFKGTLASGNH